MQTGFWFCLHYEDIEKYQNHISVLNVLIPLLHVATIVATCLRGAGGWEGMGEYEAAAGCRCMCLCLTLLLLQLMCTMPSTYQPSCTPWSRTGPHTTTSSPWTLKPDACRISKATVASFSAATHQKCSLCMSRVCRLRSSGRNRRSRCDVKRGK